MDHSAILQCQKRSPYQCCKNIILCLLLLVSLFSGSKKVKWSTGVSHTPEGDNGPVQIENIIIDNMVNESTERTYNASLIEVK